MKLLISSCVFFSFAALISLLLCSHAPSIAAQEVEVESEFNYIEGSERGPSNWGNLREDWKNCSIGEMQSPIDIRFQDVEAVERPGLVLKLYKPARATIKNRGHDVAVEWEKIAGLIIINSVKYYLRQCHWHSPSEHTINGKRFDLEVHIVHQSLAQNRIAVFGLLYNIGQPDSFLSELLPYIRSLNHETKERDIGRLDPNIIGVNTRKIYKYMGSLTTPPCTQGVIWGVNNVVKTVSLDQLYTLRAAVHDESNARPVQPLNGRQIMLFNPLLVAKKDGPSN